MAAAAGNGSEEVLSPWGHSPRYMYGCMLYGRGNLADPWQVRVICRGQMDAYGRQVAWCRAATHARTYVLRTVTSTPLCATHTAEPACTLRTNVMTTASRSGQFRQGSSAGQASCILAFSLPFSLKFLTATQPASPAEKLYRLPPKRSTCEMESALCRSSRDSIQSVLPQPLVLLRRRHRSSGCGIAWFGSAGAVREQRRAVCRPTDPSALVERLCFAPGDGLDFGAGPRLGWPGQRRPPLEGHRTYRALVQRDARQEGRQERST